MPAEGIWTILAREKINEQREVGKEILVPHETERK
jgi:hypothetical protein